MPKCGFILISIRIEKIRTPVVITPHTTLKLTAIAKWTWSSWISIAVMLMVVGSTLFLVGSGRRSIGARVTRLVLLGQTTLAGPRIFVWPFGSFLALFQVRLGPLQVLDLTTLGPVWETIFFSIFCLIDYRFSPNSYIMKVFDYKILLYP